MAAGVFMFANAPPSDESPPRFEDTCALCHANKEEFQPCPLLSVVPCRTIAGGAIAGALVILAGGVDTSLMKRITLLALVVMLCLPIHAIAASITIAVDKPGHPISPTLNGIFFEDINFAGDGGLYPQRVKNGSFEFSPDPTMGWRKVDVRRGPNTWTFATIGL